MFINALCLLGKGGGTLNSRRATSSLVRWVEGVRRWEAPDHPQDVLPQNWSGNDPNRTGTCLVFKAMANDRRQLTYCRDEFRGPRSGPCRSDDISKNNKTKSGPTAPAKR
ncbi:uncharacterized protein TNCV_1357561 [Trichonephila clavipes]|uniref:Uncharacterized protein n=1 Tax=Trichonephila clavipes TaxID=2585209 RepID=A0A8X6SBK1_TRICX|nr:uncharacterized protein TNCV_1357561 [Trichonephila clavipes]